MKPSSHVQELARYLASVMNASPSVARYWDDNDRHHIDIMSADNVPERGVVTLATLGLSDQSIGLEAEGSELRVELLAAVARDCKTFPNILATSAFDLMTGKAKCRPRSVVPNVVAMYESSSEMKHVLLVPPFLWEVETQKLPGVLVTWLQVVPISESEYAYAQSNGADALEDLFVKEQIDVFDLCRPAIA